MSLRYEGSAKHKNPWQPGRKGTLCPSDISLETAEALLRESVPDPNPQSSKRYGTHNGQAFCAMRTGSDAGNDVYHGYPVGFGEVPPTVWRAWISDGRLQRADVTRNWMIGR